MSWGAGVQGLTVGFGRDSRWGLVRGYRYQQTQEEVQDIQNEWREQPGQYAAPWVPAHTLNPNSKPES